MILLFSSWRYEWNIMFRGQLERKTSEVMCQCFQSLIKGSTVAWGLASQLSVPGSNPPGALLCTLCMFSLCLHRFSPRVLGLPPTVELG